MGAGKYSSLRIEYSIAGEFQTGREIFLQKDRKTSREVFIKTKVLKQEFLEHTLEIDDGEFFFRVNLIDRTGIKMPSINRLKMEMIRHNPHLYQGKEVTPMSISPAKGALNRTESVLGRECKIFLENNKLIFVWDEIILKEVLNVVGETVKIANNLDLNQPLEDRLFEVPKDIQFQDQTKF